MNKDFPLTSEEFRTIYSKVPRLCIDIILKNDQGVYLTLRDIAPCKDTWHLPGGTVFFGELLQTAVQRIAKRELGIKVTKAEQIGIIEFPSHLQHSFDYPLSIVFEVHGYEGDLQANSEASKGDWFRQLPKGMHEDQDQFLLARGYVS